MVQGILPGENGVVAAVDRSPLAAKIPHIHGRVGAVKKARTISHRGKVRHIYVIVVRSACYVGEASRVYPNRVLGTPRRI